MNIEASTSEPSIEKTRKRKAKPGLNGCSGPEVAKSGVTSQIPTYRPPAKVTIVGPTGEKVPEGVTTNTDAAEAAYVAARENPSAEAFWALLERVGYTVW